MKKKGYKPTIAPECAMLHQLVLAQSVLDAPGASSHPDYDLYVTPEQVKDTNCFGFTLEVQRENLQPGTGRKHFEAENQPVEYANQLNAEVEGHSWHQRMMLDEGGFTQVDINNINNPPHGAYLIAFFAREDDFHFLIHADGRWHHKPGNLKPTHRDVWWRRIRDVTKAYYAEQYTLQNYYWVIPSLTRSYREYDARKMRLVKIK